MENPHSLVMWEAQFGDFANGGQVIIDNFLSSCEAKWLRQNALFCCFLTVMMAKDLNTQMSNENPFVIPEMNPKVTKQIQECNWQVVNITTPANYFHVLRRQIHREFRKPLIVMSPKYLLRHKECKSKIYEFVDVEGHDQEKKVANLCAL
ncbi:hypothetical protein PIB30_079194 [Stylosanthes scabra]|uniref:Transketolase-like pyrimidine-binding domain-containing protein n=1 Tax=Stylosanthes scabra TaxID=79078 RepID=A0ABU6WPD0_9FABA|nr:hypothetical protein [Stylosanthes scabra]